MDQHLIFLLLGLANGAVYAALALTLVITYRSSGVVNFATGTMALLGAYTYAFLRQGEILIPLPGFPDTIELPFYLGLLAGSADLGGRSVPCSACCSTWWCSGRRDRHQRSPRRSRRSGSWWSSPACSSIRVGATGVRTDPDPAQRHLDDRRRPHHPGPRLLRADDRRRSRCSSSAAYRFTRFGLETRAAAETEKGAFVSGINPDRDRRARTG